MKQILLKDLKRGECFTLKPIEEPNENQVYIKDDYCRPEKKYICLKWSDVLGGGRAIAGNTKVYIDFYF